MSDIAYEDDQGNQSGRANETEQIPFLAGISSKIGLQPNQIYYVLICISVIFTFVVFSTLRSSSYPTNEKGGRLYIEDIPANTRQAIPPEILEQIPSRYAQ